jgi:hypothetical protein
MGFRRCKDEKVWLRGGFELLIVICVDFLNPTLHLLEFD